MRGELVSLGGKRSGAWPNYWNVKNSVTGEIEGVDLDKTEWTRELDEVSRDAILFAESISHEIYLQNFNYSNSDEFKTAKENEVQKWKEFGVYEIVNRNDFPDDDILSSRWVTEIKYNQDH